MIDTDTTYNTFRRCILAVFFLLQTIGATNAQHRRPVKRIVDANYSDAPLELVLADMSAKAGFDYAYNAADLDKINGNITLVNPEITVQRALDDITRQLPVSYRVKNNVVIISAREKKRGRSVHNILRGIVLDEETGKPLAGVLLTDLELGPLAETDSTGMFSVGIVAQDYLFNLEYSKDGYQTKRVNFTLKSSQALTVGMKRVERELPVLATVKPHNIGSDVRLNLSDKRQIKWEKFFAPAQNQPKSKGLEFIIPEGIQLGLVPSVSTNGKKYREKYNTFSFNLYVGYSAGLEGFELGTIANIETYNVGGTQIAGIANIVGGNTKGLQLSAVTNISSLRLRGAQITGLINVASKGVRGLQLAAYLNTSSGMLKGAQISGGGNYSGGGQGLQLSAIHNRASANAKFTGAQISAGFNLARGNYQGAQISAGFNHARQSGRGMQIAAGMNWADSLWEGGRIAAGLNFSRKTDGFQVAGGLNLAGKTDGIQIAPINLADTVAGLQIGVINLAKKYERGAAIGFFSFVKDGLKTFELSTDELGQASLNFRTGVRKFYNIFGIGYLPGSRENIWTLQYGIGTELRAEKKVSVNLELLGGRVTSDEKTVDGPNIWGRFTPTVSYRIGKSWQLFGGLSLNGQWRDNKELPTLLNTQREKAYLISGISDSPLQTYWWGHRFGLRFDL
ncbi:hypothetical protein FUAX_33400 [Fulvitalea axinellae]|uniref:Secretin/TonB short N-terminal domain-containing protein n=1 Tax=Fulvitalea axinellae TaxID=1182444 RepID=A0AAU9CS16_9BACT|nr:hypothetical protein FUAX_33400 [Fulvitalea axinellae]